MPPSGRGPVASLPVSDTPPNLPPVPAPDPGTPAAAGSRRSLAIVAGGVAYAWWRFNRPADPAVKARRLLGVPDNADAATIQTAWRIAMSNAHPDAGGSDAAARAVTEARDLLLAALKK